MIGIVLNLNAGCQIVTSWFEKMNKLNLNYFFI